MSSGIGNGKGHSNSEAAALRQQMISLTERSAALWQQQSKLTCNAGACSIGGPWTARGELHQQALSIIARLRELEPEDTDLQRHAAYHHCGAGEWVQALAICETLAQEDPDDPWLLRIRASAFEGVGDWQAQVACLERLLELDAPEAQDFVKLGILHAVFHGHKRALEVLEQGLERFPEDPQLNRWRHICLMHCGEYARALPIAERATKQDPEKYGGWVALGNAHKALGNLEEACTAFRRAFALEPGMPQAFGPLLQILREQGCWEELDVAMGKARASLNKELLGELNLAPHFFRRGRILQALTLFLGGSWTVIREFSPHWRRLPWVLAESALMVRRVRRAGRSARKQMREEGS